MAGQLTIDTLKASSGVLATQNGMSGIAKAWVNFVGSSASINASFNVSSVTRSAAGSYTVNFSTSMPDANFAAACSAKDNGVAPMFVETSAFNVGYISIVATQSPSTFADSPIVTCTIFR